MICPDCATAADLLAVTGDRVLAAMMHCDRPESCTCQHRVPPQDVPRSDGKVRVDGGGGCTCPLGPEDAHFPDCPMWRG